MIVESHGIVSVDTVTIHIAAIFDIPCAALFRNTPFLNLWKPNVKSCSAVGLESSLRTEGSYLEPDLVYGKAFLEPTLVASETSLRTSPSLSRV